MSNHPTVSINNNNNITTSQSTSPSPSQSTTTRTTKEQEQQDKPLKHQDSPKQRSPQSQSPSAITIKLKRPISPDFHSASTNSPNKRAASEENLANINSSTNSPINHVPMLQSNDTQDPTTNGSNTPVTISAPTVPPLSPPELTQSENQLPTTDLPSPQNQFNAYQSTSNLSLDATQTWYLISLRWFKRWQTACATHQAPTKNSEDPSETPISIDQLGPIDNSDLLDSQFDLKPGLQLSVDLEILAEPFWNSLLSWYGIIQGPRAIIPRRVIAPNGPGSQTIEFYPPRFHFYLLISELASDECSLVVPNSTPVQIRYSIANTLAQLKTQLVQDLFDPILSRPLRLWRLSNPPSQPSILTLNLQDFSNLLPEPINPESDQIDLNEALLTDPENYLVIEQQTDDGNWLYIKSDQSPPDQDVFDQQTSISVFGGEPWLDQMDRMNNINKLDPKYKEGPITTLQSPGPDASVQKTSSSSTGGGIISQLKRAAGLGGTNDQNQLLKPGMVRGLVGLSNLGNTCFMNSALQCMSNCPELKQYFLSRVYINELNRVNPLGMGGKVAETFGQLIEKLWNSTPHSSIAPREFKSIVGRFNSLFLGYGQQDSQELLTFLLDALHEDLNRVLKKPFDEIPDFKDGDGDLELIKLAETCWNLYRRRNDSVIVDLFQGQYKSTLVCPDCQKVAIKFDEIMYLTLQLPVNKKQRGTVFFIPLDHTKPRLKVVYELPKDSTIRQVKQHIGKILGYDPEKMAVIEDWSAKPWKIWQDPDQLDAILERDVINIFETPMTYHSAKSAVHLGPSDHILVPVVSYRPVEKGTLGMSSSSIQRGSRSFTPFGFFFLVSLGPDQLLNHDTIYNAVVEQYARYTKKSEDLFEEEDAADETQNQVEETNSEDVAKVKTDASGDVEMTSAEPLSTATKTNTKGKRQAVPNLFRISVPAQPTPTVIPTSNGMGVTTVALKERELHGRPDGAQSRPTVISLPGNFSTEDAEEDLYGDRETTVEGTTTSVEESKEEMIPSTSTPTIPSQPIVRQGDFFECEWTSVSAQTFFPDRNQAEFKGWSEFELIEDPEMIESSLKKSDKKQLTIEDCFKDFSKPERLGEEDMWYCPRCQKHVQAIKTMQIWKVPDILVVHFKRFSNARTAYGRSTKVDAFVEFPIEGLDLSDEVEGIKVARRLKAQAVERKLNGHKVQEGMMVEEEEEESLIYDLFAVDNHFGGLGGGHYTAFAKNATDGKWHNFDDSHVSEVDSAEKVKSSAAYLLFYRRRTNKNLGSKTHKIVSSALGSTMMTGQEEEEEVERVEQVEVEEEEVAEAEAEEDRFRTRSLSGESAGGSSARCLSPSSEPQALDSPRAGSIFDVEEERVKFVQDTSPLPPTPPPPPPALAPFSGGLERKKIHGISSGGLIEDSSLLPPAYDELGLDKSDEIVHDLKLD
ncbi:ubiquitin C-terminal hydrolase [Melampsora larici-populina 98AG31]|uniref:ubiquitinyl hydrolase 1 n=1 Tax=Melampsora larici-populina (strain 98AG31 / pathotype 3-4-7) TaxID=747676 RepID=F4RN19_MELLP|nr:ubiquitin C-terminal hydrolase [Melampsora larici-populina 98AG31]EGG06293.1 ubiquitin C-terminal hydrolase [Melampsora larici-populina 98AG31]